MRIKWSSKEGNNSDSVEGLKSPLIKYIPPQTAPAFFKLMMQTLALAMVCHSIHQRFSLRIIAGDASGMWLALGRQHMWHEFCQGGKKKKKMSKSHEKTGRQMSETKLK